MKFWLVPYGELDDQRVLGQHREAHMIVSTIIVHDRRHKGWELLQHRQDLLDQHEHIVAEMQARGFTGHASPVEHRCRPEHKDQVPYPRPQDLVDDERWLLVLRWGGQYCGRVQPPPVYQDLIQQYWSQGGCVHNGDWEKLGRRRWLCLLCKNYEVVPA